MGVLNTAIKYYRDKNFAKALELFEEAGKLYGPKVVETNIHFCKKSLQIAPTNIFARLATNEASVPLPSVTQSATLDFATRYMLSQMGQMVLSAQEQEQCLEHYSRLVSHKSEDAEVKHVNPIPADWPKDLELAPLPDSTNDWRWNLSRRRVTGEALLAHKVGLSVVVPTFNRGKILDITLACLVNQQTTFHFEVVVADDGSQESIDQIVRRYESLLDIKYVRQKDYGYQLCAIRNLGLRIAKYDYVAILDCDMAPNHLWVHTYLSHLIDDDDVALIGPRKYIDTDGYSASDFLNHSDLIGSLPEVFSPDTIGRQHTGDISIDWRLDHFQKTEDLRLCDTPFRFFSGGNVAFARKWLGRVGWFDEEFTHWGGEDNEFGYRLYRHGCFFRAVSGAMAYHQEPPGKENETDRAEGKKVTINIVREKVPYFYRTITPLASATLHNRPLVSIYIPAYNCADNILRCVDSALNQTVVDLEVCICNDGSTDNTLDILEKHYGHNPRVSFLSQENGGIGRASNTAVRMARGYYIGQLDADDYLEPDAVEVCLKELFADRRLACVYTTSRNVNSDGTLIANGYNWPVYSREKLTTAMIAHHFRMFTARAWHLTEGFDESITNAVDYDIYLKLSEVGPFKHINKICYNRVLHGKNTSIKKLDIQKYNHFKVVNKSFGRQGVKWLEYVPLNEKDEKCRKYLFLRKCKSATDAIWRPSNVKLLSNQINKIGQCLIVQPIVGLIRFNLISKKEIGSYISSRERQWDEHVATIMDHERLIFRSSLLINGVLKQISIQTLNPSESWFRLIVVISTLLPSEFKSQLYTVAKSYSWLQIVEKNPEEWVGAEQLICNALNEITCNSTSFDPVPFLSFRLDDDDFLPVDYLERCQSHIAIKNINKFLTYKNGAKILWSKDNCKICNYEKIERPFIAIGLGAVCRYDPSSNKIDSKVKSVFAGISHYDIKNAHEFIVDNSDHMFIWSHHNFQDTHGVFKSVEFKGPWDSIPADIYGQFVKYPALVNFL